MRDFRFTWSTKIDKAIKDPEHQRTRREKGSDRVKITIADNDVMWLEVNIPNHLRVEFKEEEIARHLKHMTEMLESEEED